MALYQVVEKHLSGVFTKYGQFISRFPGQILAIALIISGALGLGIIWVEAETNLDYLYTPENSQAAKDQQRLSGLFPDNSGTEFYIHQSSSLGLYGDLIILSKRRGENVLTSDVFSRLNELDAFIKNITVAHKGQDRTYSEICARRFNACYVDGISQLFNGSATGFFDQDLTYPIVYKDWEQIFLPSILGGVELNENLTVKSAEALRVRYYLRNDEKYRDISIQWEKEFLQRLSLWNESFIEIAYAVSNSLNYELDSGTSGDVTRFAITFTVMIFYATFVCGTGNCITTRGLVASTGVYSAGLAIMVSFGFCSYIGVKTVNIVGIMPFLVVGIGIDDMFILMSGWLETKPSDTVQGRVSSALGITAVSITITSLTNLLAFSIGATSVFPAVRNFCIYTGVAVIWCYVMQLTVFGSCLVFHTRRVKSQRHYCTCRHIPSEESCRSRGKCCYYHWIMCCRGKISVSDTEDVEDRSIFERLPMRIANVLLLFPVKILVLLIFAGYLGVSIWGASQLQQGLILNNLVPPSSYLHPYLYLEREYFTDSGPTIAIVFDGPLNYWDGQVQREIDEILEKIQSDKFIAGEFLISWLESFSDFHNGTLPTHMQDFLYSLQFEFLPSFPVFDSDLLISDDGQITASRFYVRSVGLKSSYEQGRMMLKVREIVEDSHFSAFAYSGAFVYFEQYVQVLPSTLLTVGCAVAAMFLVCLIFIPHPLCVIYVTASIVMITVGLFGFMHFWGLSLSSITMIHIVMSIGFSVDFSAHVCHAFMKADGIDRNHRVEVALSRVAVPILNGGISTIIGIIILVNSDSYVFQSFFRIMLLTIVFGIAHAIFLLPVVLSFAGPSKVSIAELVIQPNNVENEKHVEPVDITIASTDF